MTTQAPLRSRWTKAESAYHVQVTGDWDDSPLTSSQDTRLLGVGSMPWLGSLFRGPDLWVQRDEAHGIHLEFSNELSPCTLITVDDVVYSLVHLLEWLKRESRKAQPRGFHLGLLTNRQVESTDGKEICRWAKVKVQIDASRHLRALSPIDAPGSGSVNGHPDTDGLVTEPPGDPAGLR